MNEDRPIYRGSAKLSVHWRKLKQVSAPEAAWGDDLHREAGVDARTCNHWVRRLKSANLHIRQDTLHHYHELPASTRRLLIVYAYRRADKQRELVLTTVILASVFSFVAAGIVGQVFGSATWMFVTTICLLIGFIVMFWMNMYLHSSREQELVQNLIDGSSDPRLVPFLLLRLNQVHRQRKQMATRQYLAGRSMRNALARLLPYVQESDAEEWTSTLWKYLLFYLRHPFYDVELTLLTIQACAQVGNEEAVRAVKELTAIDPVLPDLLKVGSSRRTAWESSRARIEQKAQECLPLLEARLLQQRQIQTLLRPSGATLIPAGETLLRPARANDSATPAEQLLRPQSLE